MGYILEGGYFLSFLFCRLVIKVPWFNIMSKSTEIEIDGLHLLVVPSTSVRYDEKNERKIQFEAKQKRYKNFFV